MNSTASTPDEYIASLPDDRRAALSAIRDVVNKNIDPGFKEGMGYGMMGWVVPHSLYPAGYHCDPKQPLSYMGVASQKNHISIYSMCLYSDSALLDWFRAQWPKHSTKKLDMGKSCMRFKKLDDVPLDLIGELAGKFTPQQWIEMYERELKR